MWALKRWTKIEDCPKKPFWCVLKKWGGWKIKIKKVYVHTDSNFLAWKDLRGVNSCKSLGNWLCILYLEK